MNEVGDFGAVSAAVPFNSNNLFIRRYTVELAKPLGLVLEEKARGGIFVGELVPEGNAARDGRIGVGDRLVSTSAVAFTTEQFYNDVAVRGGEQAVVLDVTQEKWETVMAAMASV